ncbi:MAG: trypsin-like serine protease, partial [Myxococcota bacterium]
MVRSLAVAAARRNGRWQRRIALQGEGTNLRAVPPYSRPTSLLLLLSLAGCSPGPEAVAPRSSEVVYGDDGRLEPEDAAPGDAALTASVGALVRLGDLRRVAGGRWDLSALVPDLQSEQGLCDDESFLEQPTAGFCSGTLIADDLVLTAGHCLSSADCRNTLFVFDYTWADGELGVIEDQDVFECARVVARRPPNSIGLDPEYAIFQLDRPATGRPRATATPHSGGSHPRGGP